MHASVVAVATNTNTHINSTIEFTHGKHKIRFSVQNEIYEQIGERYSDDKLTLWRRNEREDCSMEHWNSRKQCWGGAIQC